MISKAIVGSITKIYLKKIRLRRGVYEWTDSGGIISNYGHNMIYIIFKSINPGTMIGVSNLKDKIGKAIPYKFVENLKDLLDEMSSNNSIILDKG